MASILIIDDASFMRTVIKRILTEAGHSVIGEASNGLEGYHKYKELNPDIVTLDITMRDMNGLEALRRIRDYDENAKVIMCSAMGQQTMVLDAIQNGAKDFIVKPFNKDRVLEAVTKALK